MAKEVLEHCERTVLRHMDGNIKEFERLTALTISNRYYLSGSTRMDEFIGNAH